MGFDLDGPKKWVIGTISGLFLASPAGQLYQHITQPGTPAPTPTPQPTVFVSGPEAKIQGTKELSQCTKDLAAAGVTPDKAAKTCLTGIQENNEALLKFQDKKNKPAIPFNGM